MNPQTPSRFWNRQRRKVSIFLLWLVGCAACLLDGSSVNAAPVTASDAQKAVSHWIAKANRPFGAKLGNNIARTETYSDAQGQPIYYVVYLTASGTASAGFLIVSGEDSIEPIVAFCSGTQFNPSPAQPLGALVSSDLPYRVARARQTQASTLNAAKPALRARAKWSGLLATSSSASGVATGTSTLSDIRVSPLTSSEWDQENVGGAICYNYYTPNHDVCGCVATALGQLMRYYQYPTGNVGTKAFTIYVDSVSQQKTLRGGNGSGGAYDWTSMVLVPTDSVTTTQRQAIGALLYDAGISVNMQYTSESSGAYTYQCASALTDTFGYANAKAGYDYGYDLADGLTDMINANLDASQPVLLGIYGDDPGGHAIVCDGYGYSSGTLYHHLNMGWSGYYNAWYALPTIDPAGVVFSVVTTCIYNVQPAGTGEIISGRVTDAYSSPIMGATVTATKSNGTKYTATTGSNGIYALTQLPSSTTFTVSVAKDGYGFVSHSASTGKSTSYTTTSGNISGFDFVANGSGLTPNDNFADAWIMDGESWVSTDNNSDFTKETREIKGMIGADGSHSAWWTWTAPSYWASSQSVTVTTLGSSFDTLLECFINNSLSTLVTVARNDDASQRLGITTSSITFNAIPGTTYRIAVDGKNQATGSIYLSLIGPVTVKGSCLPSAGGTITGAGTHANGASVTLTATANPGYQFSNWTQDGTVVSSSKVYTFTPAAYCELVANFTQTPWDAWKTNNFTVNELSDPSISDPLQCPDHDGVCNLLKYAFRMDRHANRSALPQVNMTGLLSILYTTNVAATDLTYTVEVSNDMVTWNSGTGYTSTPLSVSSTEFTTTYQVYDMTGTARFMRVRVTQP